MLSPEEKRAQAKQAVYTENENKKKLLLASLREHSNHDTKRIASNSVRFANIVKEDEQDMLTDDVT